MRLGEAHWKAFVRYAEVEFKETFARALMPMCGVRCAVGMIDGTPCPKQMQIDLKTASCAELSERLPGLHMDHTHDVKRICDVWSHALPKEPQSWDDGICGPLLAHLLFGTEDHVLTLCNTFSGKEPWSKVETRKAFATRLGANLLEAELAHALRQQLSAAAIWIASLGTHLGNDSIRGIHASWE